MLNLRRPAGRLFYCLLLLLVLDATARAVETPPVKTTVQGVIYRNDGSPAPGGTIVVWGPAFNSADNKAVAETRTSWGRSQLAREANNYFGIKAHGQHKSIALPTMEVINEKAVRTNAFFARYDSMAACFTNRDQLILKLACYAEARDSAGDPPAFIRALARHWATDPHYAEKLVGVYAENKLENLDKLGSRL